MYITGEKYVSLSSGVLAHLSTSPVLPDNIRIRPTRRLGLFGSLIIKIKKHVEMMCKLVEEMSFLKMCYINSRCCDILSLKIFVSVC